MVKLLDYIVKRAVWCCNPDSDCFTTEAAMRQYKTYRNELYDEFEREQWDVDGLEMYLWHGTDAIDQTVNSGFNLAQTNMEFNMYGACREALQEISLCYCQRCQ